MTQTATITCQYVNQPKTGNPSAPWSIKDEKGQYWKFWPKDVGTPVQGSQIVVEYKLGNEYQGRRDQIIQKIIGESGGTAPTAPRPNGHAAAAPAPAHDDRTAERIVLCGVLNNAIQSGKVDPFDGSQMTDCLIAAREAYRNVWGGS